MQYPVDIINIRQEYSKSHRGVDFGWDSRMVTDSYNQKIYSIDDGVIYDIQYQTSGGYVLFIYHEKHNIISEYGHLKKGSIKYKIGDHVKEGDYVARMGASGNANGYHLHFGLQKGKKWSYKNGKWLDPLKYLVKYSWQKISGYSKKKNLIETKIASNIPSEPLLVHDEKNYKDSTVVKSENIYNGNEVPYFKKEGSFALIDNINKYYTCAKYLR